MKLAIGIVLALIAAGGFVGLYLYGRRSDAPLAAAMVESKAGALASAPVVQSEDLPSKPRDDHGPNVVLGVEMQKGAKRPDVTVGVDDVAGARVDANVTRGAAEISTNRQDADGRGIKGRISLDGKGQVEGRVEYGTRF